mmetsp:Transcript_15787/g.21661  ORF Transcript_15787/g.21661 Transcript_15787/m.21661 type:complete len:811 (-) Transcript_15787:321-2753(-)
MKASPLALSAVLAASSSSLVWSFAPTTTRRTTVTSLAFSRTQQSCLSRRGNFSRLEMAGAGFLGQEAADDEDEDSDWDSDDDDDDDDLRTGRSSYGAESLASSLMPPGAKLDPWDPNPMIKPRPGRYGFTNEIAERMPDSELKQTMSPEERKENLSVMRQIKKNDLEDLRIRKDHAGWVEANNDLKRRETADPWYGLNERMREAVQMNEEEDITYIQSLIDKLGGPPPGIEVGPRGFALATEIYDIPMSASRAASMLERQVTEERQKRGRAMAQERKKNLLAEKKAWEEMMRNPGLREDKEAAERRERMMERLRDEIDEDTKKKQERAKEILGKMPEMEEVTPQSALEQAVEDARAEVKRLRKLRASGAGLGEVSDEADLTYAFDDDDMGSLSAGDDDDLEARPMSGADKAREEADRAASGGRPRLPGDPDVTRGEIDIEVKSTSKASSGPLTVEVSSNYNTEQSDPPMRKHCFQYTIRITNDSETETVQLLSRRFEIQTVGSSMKDVVQGEGVTGRQPTLKPGEVFEYTSTAPLSVRPIGTTEIAARMRGEYKYVILKEGQDTATPEEVSNGGDAGAELAMFHFVFPEEQRVKPFRPAENDEDEEDDEDEAPATPAPKAASSSSATASAATPPPAAAASSSPASTLPGDSDMTSGDITMAVSDTSNTLTDGVRVQVTSTYRPERSDMAQQKHCFAYNIRITNESPSQAIQLVSRRFEIQTIGSANKDVVQGPGVTGRQPILKPGESFEYTSTAPLSVRPMTEKTPVVARMAGEYNFVLLGEDGTTPLSSTPLQAKLGMFHFVLPALEGV